MDLVITKRKSSIEKGSLFSISWDSYGVQGYGYGVRGSLGLAESHGLPGVLAFGAWAESKASR